jgi:hypothetical protein
MTTACLLGAGDWLARHVLIQRIIAIVSGIGLTLSFFLPVLYIVANSPILGWEAFWYGAGYPVVLWSKEVPPELSALQVALDLIAFAGSAYGTVLAYPALVTACWCRENRWRRCAAFVSGVTVACAASVALTFIDGLRPTNNALLEYSSGYYVWLVSLAGIYLAHAPRRYWATWLSLATAMAILGLAALAFQG